ncbi:MAG: DNA gyrase subunit A [Candidatus Woesearchaeota archaeon]|nr:DNA gyrase subunit A [Candidatus Woesearchaeota archaeon]
MVLTEKGIFPIQDVKKGTKVYTQDGLEKVSELYIMPKKKLLKVVSENGIENTVTRSQKFKVLTEDWDFVWKEAKDLEEGDYIVTKCAYPEIKKEVQVSEKTLNENTAYLLGQIISDGSICADYGSRNHERIAFHTGNEYIVAEIVSLMRKEFGYAPTIEESCFPIENANGQFVYSKIVHLRVNRLKINQFLVQNYGLSGANAYNKKIPQQIFQSPKNVVFRFMSGLIDGDGHIHKNRNVIHYGTVSKKLAQQILVLMQHFDIHGRVYKTESKPGGKINGREIQSTVPFYNIEFKGDSAQRLAAELTVMHDVKAERAKKLVNKPLKKSSYEKLPFGSKKIFEELSKHHIGSGWYKDTEGRKFRAGVKYPDGAKIRYCGDLHDKPLRFSQIIEWGIRDKLQRIGSELHDFLQRIMENKVYFTQVRLVEEAEEDVTYDIQVENKHEFVANGMLAHNCLGKYHPHGDQSVYDALVRMAQDFSLRLPLVSGQGNFGSIDSDPPAAMRYTEARLAKISDEMLQDLDKETVEMVPNFDGSLKEPSVLPAKVPNLLMNGSSGIAVGMATNIPPHNLQEVAAATTAYIDNPEIETFDLAKLMPGPDFPTGGVIQGKTGIMQYYGGGRGKLKVRAVITLEETGNKKKLIISEIPYMVSKSLLVAEIANAVKSKKVEGIADILDESDRKGMRVVIVLKQGASPEVVENQLYHRTRARVTFGVIMVAIHDKKPKLFNLKQVIQHHVEHRQIIVRKRTEYDLKKAQEKEHILEGLVVALDNIDAVVDAIKKAKNAEFARAHLTLTYKLTEKQANAILEMRLSRLTGLEQEKIRNDLAELKKLIGELQAILASEQKILDIIKQELQEVSDKHGSERRTQIIEGEDEDIDLEDLIEPEDVVVTISNAGYCKRLPVDTYRAQHRGGKGIIGTTTKDEDFVRHLLIANTHTWLMVFTDKGRVYWTKAYNVPEGSRQSKGKPIINIVNVEQGELVRAVIPVEQFSDDRYLLFVTKKGLLKKTVLSAYKNIRVTGVNAINLNEDDNLVDVLLTNGEDTIFIASAQGMAVKCSEQDARPMGRTSTGVRGIKLGKDDYVVDALISKENESILTITENGYGKRTSPTEYRHINRGGKGVRNIITSERNGHVVVAKSVRPDEDIMLMSKNGITIRTPVQDVRVIGRATQGVRIMNLKPGDNVVACTVVEKEDVTE